MISCHPEPSRKHQLDTMKVFAAAGEDFMRYNSGIWWLLLFYGLRSNEKEPQPPEDPTSWIFRNFCSVVSFFCTGCRRSLWTHVLGTNFWGGPEETHLLRIAFQAEIGMEFKRWGFLERLWNPLTWEEETARMWRSELGCLHFKIQDPGCSNTYSLLSILLESCWYLNGVQDFLRLNQIPIEEFVRGGLPLLQEVIIGDEEPWTEVTLTALLNWDCSHLTLREMNPWLKWCLNCSNIAHWWAGSAGNELWRLSVKQIKAGKSPEGPFDGEEKQVADKWRRYYERSRTESICLDCMWAEEKAHSGLHEDGFELSPLLLDI